MSVPIDASLVKALRDRTGLGFMQCKEALVEAGGVLEKAVDVLRQKGLKSADKKADRDTSQGRINAYIDPSGARGVLLELDCESDFVARNEDFAALGDRIARHLASTSPLPDSPEALLSQSLAAGGTVGEALKSAVAKTGENIRLKRFVRFEAPSGGRVGAYVHPPGRIAVLLEAAGASDPAKADAVIKDLCMHVAAIHPVSVSPEDIPASVLEREKAVYAVQVHGKPAPVAEKMLKGKLEAFFSERCLVRQKFVKDNAVTVADHLKAAVPGLSVLRFTRFEVGA